MVIKAWIHGYAARKGDKYGAFAVRMTDGAGGELTRSYKLKGATANQAEIRAAQFVLKAITNPTTHSDIRLHTCSHYLATLLEKDSSGGWAKDPKANQQSVDELRNASAGFSLEVVKDSDSPEMVAMKTAAKNRANV